MTRKYVLSALAALVLAAWLAPAAVAASKQKIDFGVEQTLDEFYQKVNGSKKLMEKAKGALVFPSVKKAGFGIGGEYGQGALLVGGKTVAYYSTAAASIGFQIGGQVRKEVILFMNDETLDKVRLSEGWEAGVDGSVAIVSFGVGGEIDTTELNQPVLGFIFSNKGLMYNLSLEGSKFTEIKK